MQIKPFLLFLIAIFFSPAANADLNCIFLKNIDAKTQMVYFIKNKDSRSGVTVIVSCTDTDDTAKVTVFSDAKHKRSTQSFLIKRFNDYLGANFADLDADGYQDMILITAHGNPNLEMNIWKFDPGTNRFALAFDGAAFTLYRSHSNELIAYSKGGAGFWGKSVLEWSGKKLINKFNIEIPNEVQTPSDCRYRDGSTDREIASTKLLKKLAQYCSIDTEKDAKEIFIGR